MYSNADNTTYKTYTIHVLAFPLTSVLYLILYSIWFLLVRFTEICHLQNERENVGNDLRKYALSVKLPCANVLELDFIFPDQKGKVNMLNVQDHSNCTANHQNCCMYTYIH